MIEAGVPMLCRVAREVFSSGKQAGCNDATTCQAVEAPWEIVTELE